MLLSTVMSNSRLTFVIVILCTCWPSLSSASPVGTTSLRPNRQVVSSEPLLRFPFADFLANPCGLMASPNVNMTPALANWPGMVTERPATQREDTDQAPPAPMRVLATDGTPLVEQVRQFFAPLRERYVMDRNQTSEERAALSQELYLAVLEAKHLARHIYSPTALHQCDGLQLQSLPSDSALLSPTGEILLEEIYRGLIISAAHLHLMIRDAYDSARYCPSENRAQHHNIRQLTGKIETLMCLMLHSAVGPQDHDNLNYFHAAERVILTTVHRYYECSAREIRGCLVVRYADRIFSSIQVLLSHQIQQSRDP